MVPLRYYKISRKLKFHYHRLTSWWHYLWLFTAITALSLFLCFLISSWADIYGNDWFKNYHYALIHGFKGAYENYIHSLYVDSIYESAILSILVLFALWSLAFGWSMSNRSLFWTISKKVHFSRIFLFIG